MGVIEREFLNTNIEIRNKSKIPISKYQTNPNDQINLKLKTKNKKQGIWIKKTSKILRSRGMTRLRAKMKFKSFQIPLNLPLLKGENLGLSQAGEQGQNAIGQAAEEKCQADLGDYH